MDEAEGREGDAGRAMLPQQVNRDWDENGREPGKGRRVQPRDHCRAPRVRFNRYPLRAESSGMSVITRV
jgi:hypothetical protein